MFDLFVGMVRMLHLALRRRELAVVRRDSSGGWLHRYRQGSIVSPQPRGRSWSAFASDADDISLHGYTPKPGGVVVEVGAEYGTETVILSRLVGPTGRVIAIEAVPSTFRLLERTVQLNGLTNVTLRNAALADEVGTLTVSDDGPGSTVANTIIGGVADGVEVPAISLDALVAELGLDRIDFLKMNIEGAETLAVRGMKASQLLVREAVISCHDFRADRGDDEAYRSRAIVEEALQAWGFTVVRRPGDPRPWVRDTLYARRATSSITSTN